MCYKRTVQLTHRHLDIPEAQGTGQGSTQLHSFSEFCGSPSVFLAHWAGNDDERLCCGEAAQTQVQDQQGRDGVQKNAQLACKSRTRLPKRV